MVQGAHDSHLAFRICCGKLAQQESRLPLTFWAPWAKPRKTHKQGENIMQQLNQAYLCEASPEWPYHLWWIQRSTKELVLGRAMGNSDSQDTSRPRLGGSHHLPPYSILCSSLRGPHPNGFLSQDSQVGVLKLPHLGLPRLWRHIAFCENLQLRWGLKKICSIENFPTICCVSPSRKEIGSILDF
jgi:hypothetical protein